MSLLLQSITEIYTRTKLFSFIFFLKKRVAFSVLNDELTIEVIPCWAMYTVAKFFLADLMHNVTKFKLQEAN